MSGEQSKSALRMILDDFCQSITFEHLGNAYAAMTNDDIATGHTPELAARALLTKLRHAARQPNQKSVD